MSVWTTSSAGLDTVLATTLGTSSHSLTRHHNNLNLKPSNSSHHLNYHQTQQQQAQPQQPSSGSGSISGSSPGGHCNPTFNYPISPPNYWKQTNFNSSGTNHSKVHPPQGVLFSQHLTKRSITTSYLFELFLKPQSNFFSHTQFLIL